MNVLDPSEAGGQPAGCYIALHAFGSIDLSRAANHGDHPIAKLSASLLACLCQGFL